MTFAENFKPHDGIEKFVSQYELDEARDARRFGDPLDLSIEIETDGEYDDL